MGLAFNRPKWVVFDVGGVLLDWQSSSQSVAHSLGVNQQMLLGTLFKYAPLMNTGQLSAEEGWSKILGELAINEPPENIIRAWQKNKFWFKSTLKTIQNLHDKYNLAILTNSWLGLSNPEYKQNRPRELRLISVIIDSSKEGYVKPMDEFFLLAQKNLGVEGPDLLLVDDDKKNLAKAQSLGWQVFYFDTNNPKISNDKLLQLLLK